MINIIHVMKKGPRKVVEEINDKFMDGMFRGPETIAAQDNLGFKTGVQPNKKKIEKTDYSMGRIESEVRGYDYVLRGRNRKGPVFVPDF